MTPREEGSPGESLLKLSEYRHMGGDGVWPNRHITFTVAKKSLTYTLFCCISGICGGRGFVENVIWVEGFGWKRQHTVI